MKKQDQSNDHQEMLVALDEWWDTRRQPTPSTNRRNWVRWLLPTPGNIIFTLLAIGGILWAQSVGAITLSTTAATAESTGTIPYQGRLANAAGDPLTETVNMSFRLYNAATGSAPLWTEQWTGSNGVQVSDGLFNVMLGSLTSIDQAVITGNSNLFLGITVGTDDEMTPRVQMGSVPYAVQALTVPDGSITPTKLSSNIEFAVIQSSRVGVGINNSEGWGLHEGTGNRTYTVPVTFPRSFTRTPRVVVSLARIDTHPDTHNRLNIYSTNVTKDGFDLIFQTWSTTKVTSAASTWIAYTSPQP